MKVHKRRQTPAVDHELLRERAKDHIRRREWEHAIRCLNFTLEEPDDIPMGEEFIPNKQSLLIRGRVMLILCRNKDALNDAMLAFKGLRTSDPLYCKCLSLQADCLYQMGRFEHALMHYHRGNRLKADSEEFRLGIQKATESINNALKCVKIKMKVDVTIEDTSKLADQQTVSATSFVFPRDSVSSSQTNRLQGSQSRNSSITPPWSKEEPNFCSPSARPFQKDIVELQKIIGQLKKGGRGKMGQKVENLTSEALSYVKVRNSLWVKQDAKRESKNEESLEFDRDHLPYLLEEY
ncbi:outer dynein arm-docking complex subunit 4-like isoform X2 [Tigriopus californicus]|uniref:outer dynein arm-docking complex subunit 4-like isoform X2 n=1 Tax=Tigriopus californicus TaxID=6832 RepID=UPI0027DAA7EC|nr:outer dynein arm-docking complex subunit 4-like isoform X2 [Tigriopus californicus]